MKFLFIAFIFLSCQDSIDNKEKAIKRREEIKIELKTFQDSVNTVTIANPALASDQDFKTYYTNKTNQYFSEYKSLNKELGIKDSIEFIH